MQDEKYILMNLEDEHSKKVAEAISNRTARKILDYLSSKEEAGAEEVAKELQLHLSTIDYNLKNLKQAGLLEAKHFLWSSRGKRIILYRVAKKFIVIAPKEVFWKDELKKILPFIGISAIAALIIEYATKPLPYLASMKESAQTTLADSSQLYAAAPSMAARAGPIIQNSHYGIWFFIAVLIVLGIYLLIKLKRKK